MNTQAPLSATVACLGKGMVLAAGAFLLGTPVGAAPSPQADLPQYQVPSGFEGGTVVVAHDDVVSSLARRLVEDLARRLPRLDLRLVSAQELASANAHPAPEVLLTVDPQPGERSAAARNLHSRRSSEPRQVALGYDAMIALARAGDPVVERGLSVAELGAIFGAGPAWGIWPVRNWAQIDARGVDRDVVEIRRVVPEHDDPLMDAFRRVVLINGQVEPQVTRVADPKEVGPWVAEHEGALGVTSRSAWKGEADQIPLAWELEEACVPASADHIRDYSYPLVLPVRAYVGQGEAPLTPAVREWLAYLLSADGQGIIAAAGFVPLHAERLVTQREWLGLE